METALFYLDFAAGKNMISLRLKFLYTLVLNDCVTQKKFIKINDLQIIKNKILSIKLTFSRNISKYFSSNHFYIKYEKNIKNVGKEILNIPAIASIITVAWALGADVFVDKLDKTYLESLNKIKNVLKKFYPHINFNNTIYVENIMSNSFSNDEYGVLFSGGVDSTFSYLQNTDKKLNLITIIGCVIPVNNKNYVMKIINNHKIFIKKEKTNITFIESNIRDVINEAHINSIYSRYIRYETWWAGINHALIQTSLCAPLTVEKIKCLMISSSATNKIPLPYGCDPRIDNKISWANIKVFHEGYEYNRQEKIKYIKKKLMLNEDTYPVFSVCNYAPTFSNELNCSKCEKCSRTIIGLILENIDPNKCGFNINKNSFNYVKEKIIKKNFANDVWNIYHWNLIKSYIPSENKFYLYNSKQFFEWIKNYNLLRNIRKTSFRRSLSLNGLHFYSKLPKNLRQSILEAYYKAFKC